MSDQIRFESLVPELDMIEAEIKGQQYLMELPKLRNKVAWGGAGVIIASSPPSVTAETVVVTRLAREVAWFFYRIRDVAYGNQLMDSNSKFSFYRKLARRVIELQEGGNSVTGPKVVLLDLLPSPVAPEDRRCPRGAVHKFPVPDFHADAILLKPPEMLRPLKLQYRAKLGK